MCLLSKTPQRYRQMNPPTPDASVVITEDSNHPYAISFEGETYQWNQLTPEAQDAYRRVLQSENKSRHFAEVVSMLEEVTETRKEHLRSLLPVVTRLKRPVYPNK